MVKFLFVLSVLAGSFTSFAGDFRDADWGMSKQQVRAIEDGEPIGESDRTLAYQVTLAGLSCIGVFAFNNDDELYAGSYEFNETHTNRNDHIDEFKQLDGLLEEKYKLNRQGTNWMNELYRDDPQRWGIAVSLGHVVFASQWENESTTVLHFLSGGNFEIKHGLTYCRLLAGRDLRTSAECAP